MTTPIQSKEFQSSTAGQSLLPFNEKDLLSIRLLPAEFSRAVGVSKQTVSRWIKDNKVTIGADGRMNPTMAMRQVLRNCDPGRVRARLVRQAYSDMAGLREEAGRVEQLEERLAESADRIQYLEGFADELDLASELAVDVLVDAVESIRATQDRESLCRLVMELMDQALLMAAAQLAEGKAHAANTDFDLPALDLPDFDLPDSHSAARSVAEEEGADSDEVRA